MVENALEKVGFAEAEVEAEAEFAELAARFAEFLASDWLGNLTFGRPERKLFERSNLIGRKETRQASRDQVLPNLVKSCAIVI